MIHTIDQKYETNESLEGLFKRLDQNFYRAHRSFIINIYHISHLTIDGETYAAHFNNYNQIAYVSKLRVNTLMEKLT